MEWPLYNIANNQYYAALWLLQLSLVGTTQQIQRQLP